MQATDKAMLEDFGWDTGSMGFETVDQKASQGPQTLAKHIRVWIRRDDCVKE